MSTHRDHAFWSRTTLRYSILTAGFVFLVHYVSVKSERQSLEQEADMSEMPLCPAHHWLWVETCKSAMLCQNV